MYNQKSYNLFSNKIEEEEENKKKRINEIVISKLNIYHILLKNTPHKLLIILH